MENIPAPPKDTINLIVVTALITSLITLLITVFAKPFAESFFGMISRPFIFLKETIYKWIAPRNPFSISLRSYKQHIMRSNLVRMENPVGPALDVPLEHAFAPLKLVSSASQEGVELFSYVAAHRRCIVLGGPGTGKTTLMKSLIVSIINRRCYSHLNNRIPVFVVLRKLAANRHSVEQAVMAAFEAYHFPGPERFVRSAISQGKMLIILDGLDEVGVNRAFVTAQIQEFCELDDQREEQNHVLVTCRENSYRDEDLRSVIPNIVRVEPFANHHMRIFLQGWPPHEGRVAIRLYGFIQGDAQIRDICRNPLLLTILTGLYMDTDHFELPSSRERFYMTAIDELLARRPARRSIEQKFSADNKRQVLERVSLERLETVQMHEDPEEFDREAIRRYATEVLQKDFNPDEFIEELVVTNSIIKPSGEQTYTCVHRTFQEYFAAKEAVRVRVTDAVVERFGSRPDLAEVLYFYCGLIKNIPELTNIIHRFIHVGEWQQAATCLLNMTEIPEEQIISSVTAQLYTQIATSQKPQPVLEILSSLAQRTDPNFASARQYFSEAIDLLTKVVEASGASALESALATTPEVAMRVIPGLLKHESPRWREAAVRLLRDIGTDEALDFLVQLVEGEISPQRTEAAKVLASLMKTRNHELKQRAPLLRDRHDVQIWPIETYFPGKLALPVAEALLHTPETGNRAIDCAVRALHAVKNDSWKHQPFLKQWRHVPRDRRLIQYRKFVGLVVFVYLGLGLALLCFLGVAPLAIRNYINETMVILEFQPLKIYGLSTKEFQRAKTQAKQVVTEVEKLYPPNAAGLARILPWNWQVEPIIPETSIDSFTLIHRLARESQHPYNLFWKSFDSNKLPSLLPLQMTKDLDETIQALQQNYIPPSSRKCLIVLPTLWVPVFMLIIGLSFLFVDSLALKRPRKRREQYPKSEIDRLFDNSFIMTGSYMCIAQLSMVGSTFGAEYIPIIILVLCALIGVMLIWLDFPRNPLISVVDDVLPVYVS